MPNFIKWTSGLLGSAMSVLCVSACGGEAGTTLTPPPVAVSDFGPHRVNNILYKQSATETGVLGLRLDVYKSSSLCQSNRPVMLFIHGGGFVNGSRTSETVTAIAEGLNARNIDMVSIDYRLVGDKAILSPAFQTAADSFPVEADQILLRNAIFAAKEDAVDAIRWIEDNADSLCLDTSRLAIGGMSAGAVASLRMAYGLNNFGISWPQPSAVVNIFGSLVLMEDLEFREAPFITFHGQQDTIIDFEESEALAARADEIGVPYSYYLVTELGHEAAILSHEYEGEPLIGKLLDFVEAHIVGGTPTYETIVIE